MTPIDDAVHVKSPSRVGTSQSLIAIADIHQHRFANGSNATRSRRTVCDPRPSAKADLKPTDASD